MIAVDAHEPFPVWLSKIVLLAAMLGGAGCGISVLLALIFGFHLYGQVTAGALGTVVAAIVIYGSTRRKLRDLFVGHPS